MSIVSHTKTVDFGKYFVSRYSILVLGTHYKINPSMNLRKHKYVTFSLILVNELHFLFDYSMETLVSDFGNS